MFSTLDPPVDPSGPPVPLGPSLLAAMGASGVRHRLSSRLLDQHILAALADGLPALCRLLQAEPRCRAQLLALRPHQIKALANRDTWLLVPTLQGWSVVGEKGMSNALDGQQRATFVRGFRALRELPPQEEFSVLLLEFDTGLTPLRLNQPVGTPAFTRLFALMKLERRELWSLFIYSILIGGLSLAVPAAVQVLVNSIAMAQLTQPLIVLAVLLFGVLALSGATKLLRSYSAEILARRVFVRIAEDFYERIPRIAPRDQDGIYLPERCQRFFEVITVQKTLAVLVVDGLGKGLQIAAGLTLLGFYHPLLLAFDIALIAGFVLVVLAGKGGLATANEESVAKYRVAAWVRELAEHADSFRGLPGHNVAKERGDALVSDYLRFRKVHFRKLFFHLLSGVTVQILAMVTLLGLGGYLVMKGELTLGQLVAAELVVGVVVNGFTELGKYLEKLYDLLAGLEKIGMVIDLPYHPHQTQVERPVTVQLPAQSLESLAGKLNTINLEPGQRYQVQSHSAQVLETLKRGLLGHLLGQTHQPLQVKAHFPGQSSSREVSAGQLTTWSLELRQEQWNELSLLDQLRLGDPEVNQSRALEVLADVGLADWVRSLPQGVHTRCSVIRHLLTPQRRAALVLARAIVAQPVLILVGDWLDSPALSRSEQDQLRELLDTELPSSIVLSFAHVGPSSDNELASVVTLPVHEAA